MNGSFIGHWVRRSRRGMVHLVESEITNRLVMRCGRQMTFANQSGMFYSVDLEGDGGRHDFCKQCLGRAGP